MISEFKKFIMRGNVIDLAVGVIIGAAFGKIVASLVEDLLMPLIGLVLGGKADFTNLFVVFDGKTYATLAEAKKAGSTLAYGNFITAVIDFVIIAFCIFIIVKTANKFKKPEAAPAPTTKDCPQCAMPIPLAAKKCGHCTTPLTA